MFLTQKHQVLGCAMEIVGFDTLFVNYIFRLDFCNSRCVGIKWIFTQNKEGTTLQKNSCFRFIFIVFPDISQPCHSEVEIGIS
jgi:hypothetical protein